jgi:hypothetical protein
MGLCDAAAYRGWLHRKAQAHVKRDRRRFGHESCSGALYRDLIHQAVCNGGDHDHYTGAALDWTLISTFDNAEAEAGKSEYLAKFAHLPTVDHTKAADGRLKFVICSWKVNDAKSHLSEQQFVALCREVVAHFDSR